MFTPSQKLAANSKMVTIQLLKSYCLPFMMYHVDAISISSANIRILENCINRTMYRIFGACDSSSLESLKLSVGLSDMKGLGERKHYKFIDQLLCDNRYTGLLLVYVYNAV